MKKLIINCLTALFVCSASLFAQDKFPPDWLTKFESSNYLKTESYDETMQYFRALDAASDYASFFSIGKSPQGRDINCLVVSKDKSFSSELSKQSGKPLVLIICGIHSGEIEGKDASMLLLRDILITKESEKYLEKINLLVIPIFSVDAHERFSRFNRINQNGPIEMGWRATAQNLNLNRDWMKADAPEMQAMLKLVSAWQPDFIVDTHTTDGADYQYQITYGLEIYGNIYPSLSNWTKNIFIPQMTDYVESKGFPVFQYVGFKDWSKGIESGIVDWAASPRFSTGYFAQQNRICLLVETHMLKPYKDRVFSTKAVLESVIKIVNENSSALIKLNAEADKNSIEDFLVKKKYMPLTFDTGDDFSITDFLGYKFYHDSSVISGADKIVYTTEKQTFKTKLFNDVKATDSIRLPSAYLIPKEYSSLVERIKLHGINFHQTTESETKKVTRYKFKNVKFDPASYEGRQHISFEYETYSEELSIPAGTFIVPTNQRTIRIIAHLLEPKSSDSFVQWGFMNGIFEQKEYFENYVMEKVAEEMLNNNEDLRKEFEEKLKSDESFRSNSYERLNFFYQRSPYWDEQLNLYPIMRIE